MAKNAKSALMVNGAYDLATAIGDIPDASLAYLLTYGIRQSCQDAMAGKAKAAADAWSANDHDAMKGWHDAVGVDPNTHQDAKSYGDAIAAAFYRRRWSAIMEGNPPSIGGPSGPRLRGIDAIMRDIAIERIKAAAARKGTKLPAKSSDLADLVAKVLGKYGADIRAEAERRMAGTDGLEIDDIV